MGVKPSKEIRRGNISLMAPFEAKIRTNCHSRHFVEALRVRLDRSRGLVEVDALDAEKGKEDRRHVEVRLFAMGDLADPVLVRIEVDAAHRHARGRELREEAEELLLRIHQVDDDERERLEAFDHGSVSLSSMRTPFPAAGW